MPAVFKYIPPSAGGEGTTEGHPRDISGTSRGYPVDIKAERAFRHSRPYICDMLSSPGSVDRRFYLYSGRAQVEPIVKNRGKFSFQFLSHSRPRPYKLESSLTVL